MLGGVLYGSGVVGVATGRRRMAQPVRGRIPSDNERMLRPAHAAAVLVAGIAFLTVRSGPAPLRPQEKMRGVCWEGARRIEAAQLAPLEQLGVDWISQTPFGWVRSIDSPEIRYDGSHGLWGESDEGLSRTAQWARERGIKTLLKPHLWVHRAGWPGDIAMHTEEDWALWFESYERFILRYARFAEEQGLEAFAVGTELGGTTGREREWRGIIGKVREVYRGRLTYCANWNEEPERIGFWDALDFIGIQAYYPLAAGASPSRDKVRVAWGPVVARLDALAKRTRKAVVFTEVGYRSQDGALERPWEWDTEGTPNLELQRTAFAAMFDALWDRPWFGGTFVWKWHPVLAPGESGACDFTPQGKPALDAIRAVYLRDRRPQLSAGQDTSGR